MKSDNPAGPSLQVLMEAIERLLRGFGDHRAELFLSGWPPRPWRFRKIEPAALPVLSWLDAACSNGAPETASLLAALRVLAADLAWAQTYSAADVSAAFLERYGWSELVGLRGPLASRSVAAGFLLLGPETEYPSHRHAAAELYVPLAGTAAWRRGGGPWRPRAPGAAIYHASGESHAMRTADEPLLALYLWRGGDLAEKSRFVRAGGTGGP